MGLPNKGLDYYLNFALEKQEAIAPEAPFFFLLQA